jgi:hypothetical protein
MWTPQGRSFDGNDDQIVLPAHTCFGSQLSNGFTFDLWLLSKTNAVGTRTVLGAPTIAININQGTQGIIIGWIYDGEWKSVSGVADSFTVGRFTRWTFTYDRVNMVLYRDGELFATRSNTGAVSVGAADPLFIGSSSGYQYTYGVIGEVWVYNRALTPLEVMHNQLATKWRYQ